MTCSTLDIPVDLVHDLRTATAADINAKMIRQVEIIVKVATTSSNLKGTYIKALKEAAFSFAAGTVESIRWIRNACSTRVLVPVEARPSVLEKENEALRKELAAMAMSAPRVCSQCGVLAYESGRPSRSGQNDGNERLAALELIEDSLRGGSSIPEARPRQESVESARTTITTQLSSLPREQQGGEWRVVQSKKKKRRKRKGSKCAAMNQVNMAQATKAA
jgi:hypothetical protein